MMQYSQYGTPTPYNEPSKNSPNSNLDWSNIANDVLSIGKASINLAVSIEKLIDALS